MRELSGKKKQGGKSGHKRGSKHKPGSHKHSHERGHGREGGDSGGHGHHHHGGGGQHMRHASPSRLEHHIVRGINILGLLVEWGLNRNFNAAQSTHHEAPRHENYAGWSSPGYGAGNDAGWQARGPGPSPSAPGYSTSTAPGRIVVCTGKKCRSRWESGNLIADLQREAASKGIQVEIAPCSCMDFCDEAPLVTVGSRGGYGASSERYFADVGTRDVPDIVASAMYWRD
ncbi:(2Fe-2S) ferredoxin domain-containing protein [Xanthobacter sp. TB0136]|uniref:(2Fe-2S) ferredoxin domain-containing protein n=1 Tax=Xanthobacter sp. TB0136 TaxID=3459177 RepID=UPI00403A7B32